MFRLRSAIPDSFAIEQITGADPDYVLADQQHEVLDYAFMVRTAQHLGAAPSCACRRTSPG